MPTDKERAESPICWVMVYDVYNGRRIKVRFPSPEMAERVAEHVEEARWWGYDVLASEDALDSIIEAARRVAAEGD